MTTVESRAESRKNPQTLTFADQKVNGSVIMESVKIFEEALQNKLGNDDDFKSRLIAKLNEIMGNERGSSQDPIIDVREWVVVHEGEINIFVISKLDVRKYPLREAGIMSLLKEVNSDAEKILKCAIFANFVRKSIHYLLEKERIKELTKDEKTTRDAFSQGDKITQTDGSWGN